MDKIDISEEEIQQKHRKERKDLQAKIQSIKKTADKKKKKETAELICRLESELKTQQQLELDKLSEHLKSLNCEVDQDIVNETNDLQPKAVRISKAQRRRNKKAQNELENQRRIADQEIENKIGPRNLESVTIKEILDSRGLVLYSIPSDGDCLYQAVNHQLEVTGKKVLNLATLRRETSKYMRAHKDDMLPFMITEEGDVMCESGFEQYCDRIENSNAWGGQIELTALSEILKCPIHILQASGPPTILGTHFNESPLVLTYHRYMYGLGEHYNSTVAKSKQETEDENNFQV